MLSKLLPDFDNNADEAKKIAQQFSGQIRFLMHQPYLSTLKLISIQFVRTLTVLEQHKYVIKPQLTMYCVSVREWLQ
ncbi:MAG: hypothetical protein ACI9C4_002371 [Paraglaciecola sp.]|jgi:hypothetical protein